MKYPFALAAGMGSILLMLATTTSVYSADPKPAKTSTKQMAPLLDLGAEAKKSALSGSKLQNAPAKDIVTTTAPAPKPMKPISVKPKGPVKWGYVGKEGPEHWGDLSEEFATCKTGKNQSPIDLKNKVAVGTTGMPGFDVYYRETAFKIINTGKTVKVKIPLGSYIKINDHRYELLEYQFHTPSEHQLDGFNYPMEMQLIHRDGEGNYVVIAVIFQEGDGNEYLSDLLTYLPKDLNKLHVHEKLKIHPARFFPANKKFYKYTGSLTTPPCSEGVYWMVFQQPVEASVRQLQEMADYLGTNSRPIQPLGARTLLKSWPDQTDDNKMYEFY